MLRYRDNDIKGESRTLEFKESIPKKDQIIKTCVAFANGAGMYY